MTTAEYFLDGVRPEQIASLGLETERLDPDPRDEEPQSGTLVWVPDADNMSTLERMESLTGVRPLLSEGL